MSDNAQQFENLQQADWSGVMRLASATMTIVDAPDVRKGRHSSYAGEILAALALLPSGKAARISPANGRTISQIRQSLINAAAKNKIPLSTTIRDGVLTAYIRSAQ